MNGETGLVRSLVERLKNKLPLYSDGELSDISRDEVIRLTCTTLIEISKQSIDTVIEEITALLEHLHKQFRESSSPESVLRSEAYVIQLLADCCTTNWTTYAEENDRNERRDRERLEVRRDSWSAHSSSDSYSNAPSISSSGSQPRRGHDRHKSSRLLPQRLRDPLVARALEVLTRILKPIPTDCQLPPFEFLEIEPCMRWDNTGRRRAEKWYEYDDDLLGIDEPVATVIQYLSASNWSLVFTFLQGHLKNLRFSPGGHAANAGSMDGISATAETEKHALAGIQVLPHLWANERKLVLVLQELCGCFLHLKSSAQNSIAVLLPSTILRWLENFPGEFIDLHATQKRLDGAAETFSDMFNSVADMNRRKGIAWPLQLTLILLTPEVFWVAEHMKDAKNVNVAKRATFLEGLRKSLRSTRNRDAATYCLVLVCKVSRHFSLDSESALSSYALAIQDELRDELFGKEIRSEGDQNSIPRKLMTEVLVSLARLDVDSILDNAVVRCLDPQAPVQYPIALLEACIHLARDPECDKYHILFEAIAPSLRTCLQVSTKDGTTSEKRRDVDDRIEQQRPGLQFYVLKFLTVRPMVLFDGAPSDEAGYNKFFEAGFRPFVAFLGVDDEKLRIFASIISRKVMEHNVTSLLKKSRERHFKGFHANFWRATSLVLSTLASKIIDGGINGRATRTVINFIHDYLELRLSFLKSQKDSATMIAAGREISERAAASAALEVAFLILLCSSDLKLCAAATSCLALFCEEGLLTENEAELGRSPLTMLRNSEVYLELSSQTFRLTGLVAFQKRFRRLLLKMSRPTAGILTAWEVVFSRWRRLSAVFLAPKSQVHAPEERSQTATDTQIFMEWRNYSGFLASLGGSCVSDLDVPVDDTMLAGLRWIDRLSAEGDGYSLLDRFNIDCLQLLTCSNLQVREATRDFLGTELNPKLYVQFFQALESEVASVFDGQISVSEETRITFAEQVASLMRTIVDRLDKSHEAFFSVDFGSLSLNLARYAQSCSMDTTTVLRLKIKVCQLCEVVTRKKEMLSLRHESITRNNLLELLFDWMSRPISPADDGIKPFHSVARADPALRLKYDVDRACLRALVELTYGLPLQQPDSESETGSSEIRAQLFNQYFGRFLSLLDKHRIDPELWRETSSASVTREDSHSTTELAIIGLSNLLSANIDVGLKQALGTGYHANVEIRAAFMRVLYNILIQGTEFSRLSNSALNEKYDLLLELVVSDMTLAIAFCDACPSNEVDELTISLLNIFETRGKGFDFLKLLVEHEVATTENESELLRRNCVATKMLSVYAKWKGSSYLRSTLQQVLQRLMLAADNLNLELDPARATGGHELTNNALQLQEVTKVFIDDICDSTERIPKTLRRICHTISMAVSQRFPDARYTAVGAFIFLRFFCPAIVAPDAEGLVDVVPTKEMRRGLLLIAKVLQNLANNVLFGAKEPYMFPLNDFLTVQICRISEFLRDISRAPATQEAWCQPESFDFGSCIALHKFLYDHWDNVKQQMILIQKMSPQELPTAESLEATSEQTPFMQLSSLVSGLGSPPMDVSWNRPQISANIPPAYSRFQQFMLKNAGRNVDSVVSARAIYAGGHTKDGLPAICLILRHIEAGGMDHDLVIYTFLRNASRLWHRPFCVIMDTTFYDTLTDPRDELLRKLDSLIPSEISLHLKRIYVYNMNSVYRKCFRRALRIAAENDDSQFHPKKIEYFMISGLQELQSHFNMSSIQLPKDTISVVADPTFVFQPVTRLSKSKGKIEVVVKVGPQYAQITTIKKQEIFPAIRLGAIVNDIFRIADIEEATAPIQTEDDNTFGLKTQGGKIVMFFTSSKKMEILQAIRNAKAKQGGEVRQVKSIDRLLKPDDVPGTLVNICLSNLASNDTPTRLASYNLLCALGKRFRFSLDRRFEHVWPAIAKDEYVAEILLDEMIKHALRPDTDDNVTEAICSIAASLRTVTVSGKIIAKIRKALNRSSVRPTKRLVDNQVWGEISALLRILQAVSFVTNNLAQIYLPEIFHIITMLVNSGSLTHRRLTHSLLTNVVHTLCQSFPLPEANLVRLESLLESLSEARHELLFSLTPVSTEDSLRPEYGDSEASKFSNLETLVFLFLEIVFIGAPSVDDANVWRSRWMSLVASTAFQSNPAIQPRAFTVMGCLAAVVDDDLLYQTLVALKNSLSDYSKTQDRDMLVAIIKALTKMIKRLPTTSRYLLQLFWLAMALVRLGLPAMFSHTASLLEATLQVISTSGDVKVGSLIQILFHGRVPIEAPLAEFDELYGVRFSPRDFHIACAGSLAKGFLDPATKPTTVRVLSTFSQLASANKVEKSRSTSNICMLPYSLLGIGSPTDDEAKELKWTAGSPSSFGHISDDEYLAMIDLDSIKDRELLLNGILSIIGLQAHEDIASQRTLMFLDRIAVSRPKIVAILHGLIFKVLRKVLSTSQNPSTLRYAHALARSVCSPRVETPANPGEALENALEEFGFGGLLCFSPEQSEEQEQKCAPLIEKLVEVSLSSRC
ncbi:MAG: hypothetical protein M1819_005376 [Sarea resinae]|nr:MAG: hypothetical protein M1819_005376 [Sarea resinae]